MKDRLVRLVKSVLHSIDGFQRRHTAAGFPFAVVKKFGEDQAHHLAALIAYYAFFSFMPLLLVFVTILGYLVAGNAHIEKAVTNSALAQFPIVGDQIRQNVHAISGNFTALVIGIVGAVWAGLAVANAAQNAMNSVWDVPRFDRPNIIFRTLRSVLLILLLGGGVVVTTIVNGISTGSAEYGLALGSGLRVVAALVALAANTALFTVGFRVLTVRDVPIRHLIPGAVLAAVFWQLLQLLGSYYVAHTLKGASLTYGWLALVIGLLSWFFLVAQLTILAAEVNVVLRARLWPRSLIGGPSTEADHRVIERYERESRIARQQPQQVEESRPGDADAPVSRRGDGK